MSVALQLLIGGALFIAADYAWGVDGIIALAVALFLAELIHDLRQHQRPADG